MRSTFAVVLLVLAFVSAPLIARPSTQVLWGDVIASGVGSPVSGATVHLEGVDESYSVTVVANSNGHFEFVIPKSLDTATITISATGYQTYQNTIALEFKAHSDGGIFPIVKN
jgi:hypothetical protein